MSARRRAVLLAALAALALVSVAAVAAAAPVEVHVDGQVHSTRTFSGDVAAVLARLDVEVNEADRVDPAPDAPIERGLRVVVTRAKTVQLHLEDDAPRTVTAVVDTVADVFAAADLTDLLDHGARIDPTPDAPVADGDRIEVDLPTAVTIAVDGDEHPLETHADTVAGALEEAGVTLGEHDLVDPPTDHELQPAAVVTVRRVDIVEDVAEVPIEPDEQRPTTDDLPRGETRVEEEGEDGLRRETYAVTLIDGEEAERELVAEEIVRDPSDRVVLVGTGPTPLEQAQALLAELGYPVGPVDGVDGPQTQRALCAWRRLEGHDVSRASLRSGELEALRETSGLPAADRSGRGVTVDRTCQVLYYRQDGRWQRVHEASTGADGLPRPGNYTIQRVREGWHTSTLYPAPEPNMYNSMYFRGAIAIHGSNHVPPHPASAGCVRVTPEVADGLFADLGIGDPVEVIGSY